MALAKKQKHQPMEQNGLEMDPHAYYGQLVSDKRYQEGTVGKGKSF